MSDIKQQNENSIVEPHNVEELFEPKEKLKKKRLDDLRGFYANRMTELRQEYDVPEPQQKSAEELVNEDLQTQSQPLLTEEDTKAIAEEIRLQEEFGNKPVESFLGSAASSLTFSATDVIGRAVGGKAFAERQREVRSREPGFQAAGAITGVVAGVAASGGTSILAKGASAGVKAASKAGTVAEKTVQQFLKEFPNKAVAESIAGRASIKAANWGAEGAVYGGANLLSGLATGSAELNAESFQATIGMGALVSAGMGGAGGAIVQTGRKAFSSSKKVADSLLAKGKDTNIGSDIVKKVRDKAEEAFDPLVAAEEFSGISPLDLAQYKKRNPEFSKELHAFFKKDLKTTWSDTGKDTHVKNQAIQALSGKRIGEIIEELSKKEGLTVNKATLFGSAARRLDDFIARDIELRSPGSKGIIKKVRAFQKDLIRDSSRGKQTLTAKDVKDIRTRIDDLVNWAGDNRLKKDVSLQVRHAFKDAVDELADRAGAQTGAALREANKSYSMSKLLEPSLAAKSTKSPIAIDSNVGLGLIGFGIYGFKGAAAALGLKFLSSDLKRSMIMSGQIQSAKEAVVNTIQKSVKQFEKLKKAGLTASDKASIIGKGFVPVTTTALLSSNLTKKDSPDGRKLESPKNKQEAVENLKQNVERLANDAEYFERRVLAKFVVMQEAEPEVAEQLMLATRRAIDFLRSKLPEYSTASQKALMPGKRTLSDSEVAKFVRYVQAIEAPMSLLEELKRGTLTRDHVEALKTVYPAIYKEIQMQVMDSVQKDPSMSYQSKLQLGILLDLSTDESLLPENILKLQSMYVKQENQFEAPMGIQQAQKGAVNPTAGALSKLGKSNRLKTSSADIIERE